MLRRFRGRDGNGSHHNNDNSNRNNGGPSPPTPSPEDFARQTAQLIPAEVRMISGCHSEQTSADVSNVVGSGMGSQLPNPAGKSGGACTSALLEILYRHHHDQRNGKVMTFQQVLLELREFLSNRGFDQIPQLTSSRPLELKETPFSMRGDDHSSGRSSGICRALLVGINYLGQSGQLVRFFCCVCCSLD